MYDFVAVFKQPTGSPIRELWKYVGQPDMISFAGGVPSSDLFDVQGLKRASESAFDNPVNCLQYGATEGAPALREQIIRFVATDGVSCEANEIVVTTGSQQGFDLLLRTFVAPGDLVLVEEPTYPATLQALKLQQASVTAIPVDGDGMNVGELRKLLESDALTARPKLLYLVPAFSNPGGLTLSLERRLELLDLAVKYQFVIVEDDPYSGLRFEGEPIPSLLSLAGRVDGARDWVVHLGSLSKIVAPGLRVGWTIGPAEIVRRCVIAKQTADLCSSPWMQAVAAEYLKSDAIRPHLKTISSEYGRKCDALCHSLREEFGDEIEFQPPKGGMFLWARLKSRKDTSVLLPNAIAQNVMFVPGKTFFADKVDVGSLRLSYAAPSVEQIREGVKRLKRAFESALTTHDVAIRS
ncbi:UNVERIFIED_ORG: DNA-binding transcriptional MocR family regulator [Paraburkholderia sediminicola]|nr:DNA-binding transcriptional MocR family regulator [Paraburkholderia sediminicola]